MAQPSSSARVSLLFGIAILCVMTITKPTLGATYTVGGTNGWTFNVNNWPKGKPFKASDVLAFNYDKTTHNVVAVNKGYESCTSPKGAKIYQSGKDRIKLSRGQNYFICALPGHCQTGLKIAINAA